MLNANVRNHETTLGFRVGVKANSGYPDHNGPLQRAEDVYAYPCINGHYQMAGPGPECIVLHDLTALPCYISISTSLL